LNPSDNHACPDFRNDFEEAGGSHLLQLRVARDLGERGENMILPPDGIVSCHCELKIVIVSRELPGRELGPL
jgi:hypothetical protein